MKKIKVGIAGVGFIGPALHYEMVKKAFAQGIHVVCEKPLATTVTEAKDLLKIANEKELVHAVHFNIRYYPMVRQMKMMREKGELGTIYSIIGSYLQDWLFYETDYNWRLESAQSGASRAVADIGSHLIDLLEYISGLRIVAVLADFNTIHPTRKKPLKPIETYSGKILQPEDYQDVPIDTEDYASILLRFDNGNKGVVTVSQVSAGRKNRLSLEISGSSKTFQWDSENPNSLWIGEREEPNRQLLRDPSLFHKEAATLVSFPGGKQLFKEVYQAIRVGKQPDHPSYPTFEDGLRELIICDRIIESQREEKWINV